MGKHTEPNDHGASVLAAGVDGASSLSVDRAKEQQLVQDFLAFNYESKSPFHTVHSLAVMFTAAGFTQLSEADDWSKTVVPGGKYFVTRNAASLIAVSVGAGVAVAAADVSAAYPSFCVMAAHTDSPCFRVKPVSHAAVGGFLQVGVECYGGGLWYTWFDRDLTVAGRVLVRTGGEGTGDGDEERLEWRLVDVPKPILRIPSLAIHLSRGIASDGFKPNKETECVPIIGTELAAALNASSDTDPADDANRGADVRHAPLLLSAVARELGVAATAIVDVELYVSDTQRGTIGGALDEFVFAPRLDNQASCFTTARALLAQDAACTTDGCVRGVAMFDHEEVGSRSATGADSPFLSDTLARVGAALALDERRFASRSLIVSADMAHAEHANYGSKHEARHRPRLGRGLVIKTNCNQRYATSGPSGSVVREAARRAQVPVQEFVVRNDMGCGSTVGPLLAARLGVCTVDVGQAQLAMHSCREMCGVRDFSLVVRVLTEVFAGFEKTMHQVGGV